MESVELNTDNDRPFYLPASIPLEEYEKDSVMRLGAYNYKVECHVGPTHRALRPVLSVLDSGAGPNLIAQSVLAESLQEKVQNNLKMVNLIDANGKPLKLLGVIRLAIQVGTYQATCTFLVVHKLSADIILGCDFLDNHTAWIGTKSKTLTLQDDSQVPIYRRPAGKIELEDSTVSKETPCRNNRNFLRKLRVAKAIVLMPQTETKVWVQCDDAGMFFLQPTSSLFEKRRALMANGIAEIRPNVKFQVVIANFSSEEVTLRKGQVVGHVIPQHGSEVYTLGEESPIAEHASPRSIIQEELSASQLAGEPESLRSQSPEEVNLDHLTKDYADKVRSMLNEHKTMWHGTLGKIKAPPHRIQLKEGTKPHHAHPYRAGPKARAVEEEHVLKMRDQGVIEPAQAEWASPVVIVPKPDGSLRFCVDYRKLNASTVKDTYPLPRMDEYLDSLGDATVFSTQDCNSGYWQIPIAEEDQDKTTFTCHAGTYRFTRMPFGLCNAPASFQRTVDIILMRYKWRTCLVYIDDIIIFSKSIDEHLKHVNEILDTLRKAGLSLKLKKCRFFTTTVDYLGHVIRPGLLEVATKNQEAIRKMNPPCTQTQVRSFLGMCNVYRRFVEGFAKIAAPLTKLTTKEYPAKLPPLTEKQVEAFHELKAKLLQPPILRLPKQGLPFSVDTDASADQIGCALFQTHEDGKGYPIGYWSRILHNAERRYCTTERECLAVVWAVTILRPYLEHTFFTLYTDHQPLAWIYALPDNMANAKLVRWRLRLAEFNFKVVYKRGSENNIADALSRLATDGGTISPVDDDIPCFLVEEPSKFIEDEVWEHPRYTVLTSEADHSVEPISIDEIVREQARDAYCCTKRTEMDHEWNSPFKEDETGLLVRISNLDGAHQIVIPKSMQKRILYANHYPKTAGHPGGRRMFYTMRRYYYWPYMSLDIYNTVKNCEACAKESIRLRKIASKLKLFPATFPLESVALDYVGPLPKTTHGNNFLLVITDRYSKLTRAIPMKNPSAVDTAKAFCYEWAFIYGPPATLLSDNGGHFTAKFFQDVSLTIGCNNLYTTAYHPRTNGQAERFNRTIISSLRHYVNDEQKDWDDFIHALVFAYNTQVHRTTGLTPFELILPRSPSPAILKPLPTLQGARPAEVRQRFLQRLRLMFDDANRKSSAEQQSYKQQFDAHVRSRKLPTMGSYVYLRRHVTMDKRTPESATQKKNNKLCYRVLGPFEVLRTNTELSTVTILKDGLEDTVSLDHVVPSPRLARVREEMTGDQPQSRTDHPHEFSRYVFDRIVNHGYDPTDKSRMMYRVRWHGYQPDQDTWQFAKDLPYNTAVRYCRQWNIPLPSPPSQPLRFIRRNSRNNPRESEETTT